MLTIKKEIDSNTIIVGTLPTRTNGQIIQTENFIKETSFRQYIGPVGPN